LIFELKDDVGQVLKLKFRQNLAKFHCGTIKIRLQNTLYSDVSKWRRSDNSN